MAKILVVEDEPKVAGALRDGLDSEGFEVTLASTGEEGFFHASSQVFDRFIHDQVKGTGRNAVFSVKSSACGGLVQNLVQNERQKGSILSTRVLCIPLKTKVLRVLIAGS